MNDEPSNPNEQNEPDLTALPEMRYQSGYVWFVFVSSLDIMLTWLILKKGGVELNPVAELVIDSWGLPGAIGFKFALTLFVILACEITGRHKDHIGRNLIIIAIVLSSVPVVWSLSLLLINWLQGAPV